MPQVKLGEAFEFETKPLNLLENENEEDEEDLDDFENKLEKEADDMLNSWNRELFMSEVENERDLIMRNKDKLLNQVDYYDGETKFDDLIKTMKPLEGGHVFIDIIERKPEADQVKATNTLLFDRIGYLEGDSLPFESSIHDGRPNKVNLIEGPILPGLLMALMAMREGERANVILRPGMAYGELGALPVVPGNSTLFYNIKIYKIWDESLLEAVVKYEHDNLVQFPLEDKINLIKSHKEAANKFLRDGYARDALIRYKSGIKCLDEISTETMGRLPEELNEILTTLLVNGSITLNKLDMPKSASKMAKRALFVDGKNLKAYYQLISARIKLADYEEARRLMGMAMKLVSNENKYFDQLKLELDSKVVKWEDESRELYKKMASACF